MRRRVGCEAKRANDRPDLGLTLPPSLDRIARGRLFPPEPAAFFSILRQLETCAVSPPAIDKIVRELSSIDLRTTEHVVRNSADLNRFRHDGCHYQKSFSHSVGCEAAGHGAPVRSRPRSRSIGHINQVKEEKPGFSTEQRDCDQVERVIVDVRRLSPSHRRSSESHVCNH